MELPEYQLELWGRLTDKVGGEGGVHPVPEKSHGVIVHSTDKGGGIIGFQEYGNGEGI